MSKKKAVAKTQPGFFSRNKPEIILFSIAFLVFCSSIGNKYSLDDELVTERNKQVALGVKGLGKIFTSLYTEGSDTKYNFEYRPVVKATYAIEYSLYGFDPAKSHFINVLLYAISIVVLYRFLLFLFRDTHYLFSFFVCLLFAVHPLHTEVVASLKNRDEILAFLFGILTCRSLFRVVVNKKYIYILPAMLLFSLAVFSKRDAIIFPFLFILMLLYFFRKEVKWFIAVPALLFPWLLQSLIRRTFSPKYNYDRAFNLQENPLYGDSTFADRIALGAKSFGFYLKLFLIPYPLRFYYGYNQVEIPAFTSLAFIIPFLVGIAMLYVIIRYFKAQPHLSFGLAFFILGISPFLNILTPAVGIVAERFAYIGGLGLCIAFVAAFGLLFKIDFNSAAPIRFTTLPSAFRLSFLAICLVFSFYSAARNTVWYNRMTLYTNDIKHLPNSAKAHELLASEYYAGTRKAESQAQMRANVDSAITHFKRAIEIYPEYFTVYNNLGSIYYNLLGDAITPIPYFEKAIELDSNYTAAYQNLATCYMAGGDTAKSLATMQKALQKDAGKNPNALLIASTLFHKIKKFEEAYAYLDKAKKKFPESDLPHIQHSNFLIAQGDTVNAMQQLSYAVDKNTQNEKVYRFLIGQHAKRGNLQEAEKLTQQLNVLLQNQE